MGLNILCRIINVNRTQIFSQAKISTKRKFVLAKRSDDNIAMLPSCQLLTSNTSEMSRKACSLIVARPANLGEIQGNLQNDRHMK